MHWQLHMVTRTPSLKKSISNPTLACNLSESELVRPPLVSPLRTRVAAPESAPATTRVLPPSGTHYFSRARADGTPSLDRRHVSKWRHVRGGWVIETGDACRAAASTPRRQGTLALKPSACHPPAAPPPLFAHPSPRPPRPSLTAGVNFENNNEVGVFARITNAYALCGLGGSENFYR